METKQCVHCGEHKPLTAFYVNKACKDGLHSWCKKCNSEATKKRATETWEGYSYKILREMKRRSKEKGYLWDDSWWSYETILERIKDKTCEVTGIGFILTSNKEGQKTRPFVPSPDRIDNKKGYSPDNVQFVVWMYNVMKSDFSSEEVDYFIQSLSKRKLYAA